ncbi:LytR/AlgR family response regulator transcription factor [Spirosoma lituiforme]
MNSRKYIIIDDTDSDALHVRDQLEKLPFLNLAGICSSVEKATELLSQEVIDLILLDINLADQSGLTLLKLGIPLPPVIIVTAFPDFALESYEIGKASDYLLKPYTFERLLIAVNRAINLQVSATSIADPNYIFLKMGRKIQRFDYQTLDFVEGYGLYSKIVTGTQTHVVNERLASLTELLPSRFFLRVHKSYIINITKITSFDRNTLWVNNHKIPIGISYRPKLDGLLRLFNNGDSSL